MSRITLDTTKKREYVLLNHFKVIMSLLSGFYYYFDVSFGSFCFYTWSVDFSDSSQNDSLSDQDDHRAGFSSRASVDDQDNDVKQTSSSFSMYNSVSQRLMVRTFLGFFCFLIFSFKNL